MENSKNIRNFAIIAHIDHGKSTLADRLIEITGAVEKREMREQMLDSMDIERERGITIKAQTVRLRYHSTKTDRDYTLNLIDTPGHVDFTYEVSRSLAACEGVLLVVDASQGVEAQTMVNVHLALDHNLEIIPVINKIDLPGADVEMVYSQLEDYIGLDRKDTILVSAKTGLGVPELLEAIVEKIPPPKDDDNAPLRSLVLDSWYDPFQGVIILTRVFSGTLAVKDKMRLMSPKKDYQIDKLGVFTPKPVFLDKLVSGEVGFIIAGIKTIRDASVGDTITQAEKPSSEPLPGFKKAKAMVFAGLYPTDSSDYEPLRDAMEKLRLNDSSFTFEPENSMALGFGFRCGFLGLLHMDIIKERLEREFNLSLITTAPTVVYKVTTTDGNTIDVDNPSKLPPVGRIERIEEPYIQATLISPTDYIGAIMALAQEKRGVQKKMEYLGTTRILMTFDFPLNEVLFDFFDKLKSATRGYASMDYEFHGYKQGELVKLDLLLNGESVDALSLIVHREKSYTYGRALTVKMKDLIPKQMFEVAIQAAIGAKIIARETIKAKRKDVLAKCYGGDITRKRKLLEKQKEGKKRMKTVGRVEVPQEAFLAVLQADTSSGGSSGK